MAAFEIPKLRWTGVCGETITRRRFVQSNADGVYVMADGAEVAVGVSQNSPTYSSSKQEVLEIADGIVMVEAGELITVGTEVESGTNGVAVAYSAGVKLGIALTAAGASGEYLTIKMYN